MPETAIATRDTIEDEIDATLLHVDSFLNTVTGLGGCEDRAEFSFLKRRHFLQQEVLESLYRQSALAKRIVDRPAKDATREGFTIEDLDEDVAKPDVMSALENLGVLPSFTKAKKWARLYRGSVIVMAVDDGTRLEEPLNLAKCKKFRGLNVIDAFHALPRNLNPDLGSGAFAEPKHYSITRGFDSGGEKLVHHSRVLRFDGEEIPVDMQQENDGWGMSVLDPVYEDLRRLCVSRQYMESFLHTITTMIVKIKGLRKSTATKNDKDREEIRQNLQKLRNQVDNFHWMAMDSEDSFGVESKPVRGLTELEERFVEAVAQDVDIPKVILLNEQTGGLNSGEDAGAIRLYYDSISSDQNDDFTPPLNRVLDVLFACEKNARGGSVFGEFEAPSKWTISWNPLWQLGEDEKAALRKTNAETDKIYFEMGSVSADEVRQSRLIDGDEGRMTLPADAEELEEPEEEVTAAVPGVQGEISTGGPDDPPDSENGSEGNEEPPAEGVEPASEEPAGT